MNLHDVKDKHYSVSKNYILLLFHESIGNFIVALIFTSQKILYRGQSITNSQHIILILRIVFQLTVKDFRVTQNIPHRIIMMFNLFLSINSQLVMNTSQMVSLMDTVTNMMDMVATDTIIYQ